MKQEYISINQKLDTKFQADPTLAEQPRVWQQDATLKTQPSHSEFKDYMIPWYRDKKL